MSDRLLHHLARECRRLAANTETPRRARALLLRARRYLDAAHTAVPESHWTDHPRLERAPREK